MTAIENFQCGASRVCIDCMQLSTGRFVMRSENTQTEHTQIENRIKYMPISFFAMVMGMVGLTIAWEKASAIYQFSSVIYSTLLLLSLVIFVVLSALYLYKGFNFRQAVIQE